PRNAGTGPGSRNPPGGARGDTPSIQTCSATSPLLAPAANQRARSSPWLARLTGRPCSPLPSRPPPSSPRRQPRQTPPRDGGVALTGSPPGGELSLQV